MHLQAFCRVSRTARAIRQSIISSPAIGMPSAVSRVLTRFINSVFSSAGTKGQVQFGCSCASFFASSLVNSFTAGTCQPIVKTFASSKRTYVESLPLYSTVTSGSTRLFRLCILPDREHSHSVDEVTLVDVSEWIEVLDVGKEVCLGSGHRPPVGNI